MHNPIVAIVAAAVAAWIFGAVWYGLLGRYWMAALGMSPAEIQAKCASPKMPLVPMAVSFACELVIALALSQVMPLGEMNWITGAAGGAMIGVGFMFTATLVNNMFQQRRLMLSIIDGMHWVGVAAIEGAVLGAIS